jgi:hypothetical protein
MPFSFPRFLSECTPAAYLSSLCHQEEPWVQSHVDPPSPHPFRDYPAVIREPSAHLTILNHFRSVIPHIIPSGWPQFIQPTLWHHDLIGTNIFISDDELARGRISITSVIDWPHTLVGPLYVRSRVPYVFRYHSPWKLPQRLQTASLPWGMEKMSKSDQKAARDDVAAMNMEISYRTAVM